MDSSLRYCISLLLPKHVRSPEKTLSSDRRRNCAYVSFSCCVAAWLADGEQRVWLCKSEVSISYPSLLSLGALLRDLAVKSTTHGRRHSAVLARSQLDVRDAKRWKMRRRRGFLPFRRHSNSRLPKVVHSPVSCGVCSCVSARVCACTCSGAFWVPRRSHQLLAPSGLLPWWSHLRVNNSKVMGLKVLHWTRGQNGGNCFLHFFRDYTHALHVLFADDGGFCSGALTTAVTHLTHLASHAWEVMICDTSFVAVMNA